MGRIGEVAHAVAYDALNKVLKMINEGKDNEEIKNYIKKEMEEYYLADKFN